ncbi:MAG: thioredoxin domain-containing protein [Lachnospiraceae bacterium]|nr:thioredoxin domain-containing protein [Lachnospiraceae bacterium]
MSNHLSNQTSPYLLQHENNPVNWYPWCEEAFQKAKAEDKPIFLSIGYSTCHWCHVMAHESFEDQEVAKVLNQNYISIKVDKEERPDIDSIYMSVCQTFTGSGGWPTSIFMTPDQKPFYAGTYFPKETRYGMIGFKELLAVVYEKWKKNRDELFQSADDIVTALNTKRPSKDETDRKLIDSAVDLYKHSYDKEFGGFGVAPKFPAAHNLLFLLKYYEKSRDQHSLEMVEHTLMQMYKGGIFDHIGYGFSRYSTDQYFLVPHFEKMLYDNALLILVYSKAYWITKNSFYLEIAEKTAQFILREMTSAEGGFYSAQDADSDGEEGKYYVFKPEEIIMLLGEKSGKEFNEYYSITEKGNFEGKNIPNLLKNHNTSNEFDRYLSKIYDYRKKRNKLHLDDKILTSWNSLMIAAMCWLYRISRNDEYLNAAKRAQQFIENHLCQDGTLFVSFRDGKRNQNGFLDDYANNIFALLALFNATLDTSYVEKAKQWLNKSITDFFDETDGGFFLYGKDNERLIMRPKESYDGAIPSGNSIMAYNLVRLSNLSSDEELDPILKSQLNFMYGEAKHYPAGYAMYLIALSDYFEPSQMITVVPKNNEDIKDLPFMVAPDTIIKILDEPTDEYQLLHNKTTYYVCDKHSCLPPVNELNSD